MPKKSQKPLRELADTFYDWAECRWEFQRRNEAYRVWWRQNRPRENLKYPDPNLSFEQVIDMLKQNAQIFAEKLVKKKNISKDKQDEAESNTFSAAIFSFIFPDAIKIDINNDTLRLELKIDFRKINSISPLIELVSLAIRDHHRFLNKLNLLEAGKPQTYWKDWRRILIVGDLKRSGKKRLEIAKELSQKGLIPPIRLKNREESVIRSISDDWNKYKYLVDKGYLDITYP